MIFLKALKYTILDNCITVFFNTLQKNLSTSQNQLPIIGKTYSRLISKDKTETFFNCTITDIFLSENKNDYYIEFIYEDYDFIDIDYMRESMSAEEIFAQYEAVEDEVIQDFLPEDFEEDEEDDEDSNFDVVLFSEFDFIL